MSTVVLLDGGDAGGLVVDDNGIQPIAPFGVALRNELQAIAKLVSAVEGDACNAKRDLLIRLMTELSTAAVESVQHEVGEIERHHGLVYTEDGGGFICGSTGLPPIPLPWPLADPPAVKRWTRCDLVGTDPLGAVPTAAERRLFIVPLVRDPVHEGQRLDRHVSKCATTQIRRLRLGDPSKLDDPIDREIVEFFHKSVGDEALINEAIVTASTANMLGIGRGDRIRSPHDLACVVVIVIVVFARQMHRTATYNRTPAGPVVGVRTALTSQEQAVAELVADGYTNRETAQALAVSVKTIEYHLGNIFANSASAPARCWP